MDLHEEVEEVKRRAEAAKHWSDAEVAVAVRRYVLDTAGACNWKNLRILSTLDARVLPTVLEILNEASMRSRILKQTKGGPGHENCLQRASHLLQTVPLADAVPTVAPFLDARSYWNRAEAAFILGCICTEECIPWLRKAFADREEHVCSMALTGMGRAACEGRVSENVAREFYGDAEQLVAHESHREKACELLLYFNRQRATELLLSDAMLTVESPDVIHDTISALAVMRVPVPRGRLLSIIKEVDRHGREHPFPRILGNALRLLGRHQVPEDRNLLRERMAGQKKCEWIGGSRTLVETWKYLDSVALGAAAGLLASYGLEDFHQQILTTVKERSRAALTVPQRYFLAAWEFNEGVGHGSPEWYFGSEEANYWPDALAGLRAMGEHERLHYLTSWVGEFARQFGESAPSFDRRERQRQLAELPRDEEGSRFPLPGGQFVEDVPEDLEILTARYVVKHRKDFR